MVATCGLEIKSSFQIISERMIARGEAEQVKAAKRTRSRGPVLSNRAVDDAEIETPEG